MPKVHDWAPWLDPIAHPYKNTWVLVTYFKWKLPQFINGIQNKFMTLTSYSSNTWQDPVSLPGRDGFQWGRSQWQTQSGISEFPSLTTSARASRAWPIRSALILRNFSTAIIAFACQSPSGMFPFWFSYPLICAPEPLQFQHFEIWDFFSPKVIS